MEVLIQAIPPGIGANRQERQVSVITLLFCHGDDAEDVLDTTRVTTQIKKYSKVVDGIDNFFKVQKNVIFERT